MSLKFRADPDALEPQARLACGYLELTRVDEAIHATQQRLLTAHQQCSQQAGPDHVLHIYRDLLVLRGRSREVLAELGELWVARE